MSVKSVLMVCTGNICRSLMAHAVLEQSYRQACAQGLVSNLDLVVDSAGVSDEERGNLPDYRAVKVLQENNWVVPDHRARQIRERDFHQFDLLLAMTSGHYRALERLAKRVGADTAKIHYYREYDPESYGYDLEVPDPWYGGFQDFQDTLQMIERTTPNLLQALGRSDAG